MRPVKYSERRFEFPNFLHLHPSRNQSLTNWSKRRSSKLFDPVRWRTIWAIRRRRGGLHRKTFLENVSIIVKGKLPSKADPYTEKAWIILLMRSSTFMLDEFSFPMQSGVNQPPYLQRFMLRRFIRSRIILTRCINSFGSIGVC